MPSTKPIVSARISAATKRRLEEEAAAAGISLATRVEQILEASTPVAGDHVAQLAQAVLELTSRMSDTEELVGSIDESRASWSSLRELERSLDERIRELDERIVSCESSAHSHDD